MSTLHTYPSHVSDGDPVKSSEKNGLTVGTRRPDGTQHLGRAIIPVLDLAVHFRGEGAMKLKDRWMYLLSSTTCPVRGNCPQEIRI